MIERDLDREDTQNQGFQYQKTINEVNIFSDITYPPPTAKNAQKLEKICQAEKRQPLAVLLITPRPVTKRISSPLDSIQLRSSNVSTTGKALSAASTTSPLLSSSYTTMPKGSKKKVWFCDKKKMKYFPSGF